MKKTSKDKDAFLSLYNEIKKEITEHKLTNKEKKKLLALNNPEA